MNPQSSNTLPLDSLAEPAGLAHNHAASGAHWLDRRRLALYSMAALACYAVFLAVYLYRVMWQQRADFPPLAMDFLPFWSASFLTQHGHAVDAYNLKALTDVEMNAAPYFRTMGSILPWLYPPNSLLIMSPLALLPFQAAAVAFIAGTFALFAKAIHSIVPRRQTVLVTLAFPGVALVAVMGQNGMLTAALAASGLLALRRRPALAGVCFGLLCMKPHLVLLFPFALLCARSWRALLAFTLTAASTLALAALLFGPATFAAFLHNAGMAAGFVESGRAAMARVPTAFALAKLAHAPSTLAYAAQAMSAALAVAAVWYAWHRQCAYALRAATLVCASLLVSPYLYDYDLAWYGVLIAWYCRYGIGHGWRRGEREWLVVLWLAPLAGMLIITRLPFQFLPLLTVTTLGMLVRRIALERNRAVPTRCTQYNT
ncbi:glycosyltransferase family 87 protein [Paraburkholderia fungorum]|uniref:ABC transporter ATP-binding protein n=1 Tax=Paraburkholderia fungorum TaxID=134537 RepID=A0A420GZY1_9BURK|nr:glycosyltransferase family 87 protein [Paraburkholderia fungorum]RKF50654.1 ABC transporter ATP-binding protein [Paraburkholderia fungorum]